MKKNENIQSKIESSFTEAFGTTQKGFLKRLKVFEMRGRMKNIERIVLLKSVRILKLVLVYLEDFCYELILNETKKYLIKSQQNKWDHRKSEAMI